MPIGMLLDQNSRLFYVPSKEGRFSVWNIEYEVVQYFILVNKLLLAFENEFLNSTALTKEI